MAARFGTLGLIRRCQTQIYRILESVRLEKTFNIIKLGSSTKSNR